ncbi:hypothetical protein L1987_43309 [Smallanthus sonchifolius]|uniref:Uncharacterized protein n=1 Tax=Smallanthus sonchifolius TaxID=185202 RepID=A0ACB9GL50_9ASTR|nr:hypothetical protein L1987_43309 [Smallanthus sonchifolius]
MYHGTTSTSKSSGSGIALFTGNPTEEDHSTGCGGHACYASGSGLGSHHQNTSRNPPATSSANNSAMARIAEDHVALFSSCMLAYENFIGGKLTDPETIEEDFNQVDPDDMEDMDIVTFRIFIRALVIYLSWTKYAKTLFANPVIPYIVRRSKIVSGEHPDTAVPCTSTAATGIPELVFPMRTKGPDQLVSPTYESPDLVAVVGPARARYPSSTKSHSKLKAPLQSPSLCEAVTKVVEANPIQELDSHSGHSRI